MAAKNRSITSREWFSEQFVERECTRCGGRQFYEGRCRKCGLNRR